MAERSDEVREQDPQQQQESAPESTPAASEETKERARQGDEVAAARAEVEQTRAEMGETIDAIQERVDPQRMDTQRLKEQIKEQTSAVTRGIGSELSEAVRNNPAPAATAGLAVVGLLLLARGLQGRGRRPQRQGSTGVVVIDLRQRKIRLT